MKNVWAGMLAGEEQADREWMHEAETLVDQFQETRALYLTSKVCGLRGLLYGSNRSFSAFWLQGSLPSFR